VRKRLEWARVGPLDIDGILRAKHCRGVAVLDEYAGKELKEKIGKKAVLSFPEVTYADLPETEYKLAEQIREKAKGRKIISLLGVQDERKGILELIKIARRDPEKKCFYVFAGELRKHNSSPEALRKIREFVREDPQNCFFYFEGIENEKHFNVLVKMSDALFLCYQSHHCSSGMLAKAAIFEKPVIVSEGFCMGRRVRKYNLGVTVPAGNCEAYIKGIETLLGEAGAHADRDFEGYRREHSFERLERQMKKLLESSLG